LEIGSQGKHPLWRAVGELVGDNDLLKWAQEFQPKETKFTQKTRSAYFSHDGRSFAGYEAGGGWGGGWDREVDRLIGAQKMHGRNTGSGGADIESFGELNELCT
jgi:hypothetical protein